MRRIVLFLLLALFPVGNGWAQGAGQISGTVADASGAPLAGASATVVGTNRTAQTGADGRYTIPGVPAGTHTVRATRLGYGESTRQVTVTAGQTATANFQLTAQAVQLEGIVAVGYGTQRRQDVTGAVASVRAEEIKQIPTPSVGEALKGRVPGVDVMTNNYKPGDQPTIRIRGVRSMRASNDPLIVVDGVPIAGGLGDINPNTIQSIDVLKDASATAVYGSRGANGVILITTNKGRVGGTQVTYDVSYGLQNVRNSVAVFSGQEFAEYKREAYRTTNKYPCPRDANGYAQTCAAGDRDIFSAQELAGLENGVSTDWMDLISRSGNQQNHQLSITGGSEDTRFAIGGNFYEEDGVTLGMDFVRRQANFSLDHNPGRFRAGISANISNSNQNLGRGDGLWGGAMDINPLGAPYDADGNLVGTPIPDGQAWNPLLDVANWDRENLRTRTFGNAYAAYEVLDGLTLRTTFGADLGFRREGEFRGAFTQPNRGSSNNTWVERFQTFNFVSTTQADIERHFGSAHRINATALYEIQNQRDDRSRSDVQNLPYEYQKWYNLGTAGQVTGVGSNFSEWSLQSFMGRVNYTLLDRYYLTLTGRQDCSSRLAPGNKCTFFPSAAVKWRVSDENFMEGQGLFSDLSLRASYGRTGNTSIDPYQTQGSLTRTTYSFGGNGAFGFRPNALVNPALEWEKTDQYDIGLEFGVLGDRVTGSADFYVQNTFDLIMERQLPPTSGFGSILENVGQTRNTGVELTVSTINLEDFHGLRWTSDINWTRNKNEIVSLYGGTDDDVGNVWFIGQPVNDPRNNRPAGAPRVWYDYRFDGIWQLGQEAEAAKYGARPGMIRVADLNGDGKIGPEDRVILGSTFPKWTGSLANRFELGAFDLSALITARWDYMIQSSLNTSQNQLFGRYNNLRVDYWTPLNPSNKNPRPNSDQESPTYGGTRAYQDGSHWRVRNITLGYQLPSSLLGRIGGETMRIYAQAQNPFLFTSYEGFDPEGGEGAGVPSYRTLVIGASVGF